MTQSVFVAGGVRTPFTKSFAQYQTVTSQELMTASLKGLIDKFHLQGKKVGDVAFGAVMNGPSGWNLTRECVLDTSLDPSTSGYNVQRACGTGLETTWQIALKIAQGQMDWGISGGVDTNSDLPIYFSRVFTRKLLSLQKASSIFDKLKILSSFNFKDLKPKIPGVQEPRTGLSMGEHCEKMVKEWGIDRVSQDQLAFESHQKAAQAYAAGFYSDLIVPFQGVGKDTITRADTSVEKLAKLKPAFDKTPTGTLTAGNSTPLTDGSSAVLLTNESRANKENLPMLARFVDAQVEAVDFVRGEGLLMAPTIAVARMLARNNLKLQDFDFYEIHEAFAGQVLCTLKAWEDQDYCRRRIGVTSALGSIDRSKMNVCGGSLALGHPFSATGGRIVASLAKILSQQNQKSRGLVSICTAGGMGVTAILESV